MTLEERIRTFAAEVVNVNPRPGHMSLASYARCAFDVRKSVQPDLKDHWREFENEVRRISGGGLR